MYLVVVFCLIITLLHELMKVKEPDCDMKRVHDSVIRLLFCAHLLKCIFTYSFNSIEEAASRPNLVLVE